MDKTLIYCDDCQYMGGFLPVADEWFDASVMLDNSGIAMTNLEVGGQAKVVWPAPSILSAGYALTCAIYGRRERGNLTVDDLDGLSILAEHGQSHHHAASLMIAAPLDLGTVYDVRLGFRDKEWAMIFLEKAWEVLGIGEV